ncbi:hypothetical protein LH462_11505 [Laribacter hongkongensis]|uniref:hypothetical protein n=1 Tax=Laribacter hongkongensis TaxID=168471 RepID=UPI001EFD867A|nr:hypothetical protein [Laribacter hongkongensis]MCG9104345.1 hypothetical protein [Laribacter hongkongensis]
MSCIRPLGWAGLGWAGLGWAGLGWAGLGWAGLGWAGLGWAGLAKAYGQVRSGGNPGKPDIRPRHGETFRIGVRVRHSAALPVRPPLRQTALHHGHRLTACRLPVSC